MLIFCVSQVGLKTPFLFNLYLYIMIKILYIYIYKIFGLRVKINHVTKEHDIIGGMNFPSYKLSLDWFIVIINPMFSYYKSWMIFK
jgi:hypothetical protein